MLLGTGTGRRSDDWARRRAPARCLVGQTCAPACGEKAWKHAVFEVGMIRMYASTILFGESRTVQIDVFADELGGHFGPRPIGAQHGRNRFMRPKRASSANMTRMCRLRRAAVRRAFSQHQESRFFKSILCRKVALGMKRARHQLAPAVPVQEIIHRAVAG